MSAQAILATLLPIAAPQGAASTSVALDGGDTDFAALVQSEGAVTDTDAATPPASAKSGEATPAPSSEETAGDAVIDATLSLILVAQAPVALPTTVAAAIVASSSSEAAAANVEPTLPQPSALITDLPAEPPAPPAKAAPQSASAALALAAAPPKTDAAVKDASAPTAEEADAGTAQPSSPPEDKPATDAKAKPAPAEPAPPPLKPLAERTSRPLETASPSADPVSRAEGQRPGAAASLASASPATPSPAHAQAPAARVEPQADSAAAAADNSAPTFAEAHAAAEIQGQAHVHAQETTTGLSRVAVEATAQIAAQILRKLEGRSTRFEMALLPEELGRVDVKLDIDSEGRLNARLAFDNPAAAADLRGRADELRRQLEQQGFELAADAFEFAERDTGSHAFDRGQEERGRGRAFAAASRLETDAEVAAVARFNVSLSPSGVDVRV